MYFSLSKAKLSLLALLVILPAISTFAQSNTSDTSASVIQPVVRSKTVIRGRAIYGDTGLPAVEAMVRLIDPKSPRPMGGMLTNERGGFGLGGIPPGEYYLIVQTKDEFVPWQPAYGFPVRTGDEAFDAERMEEFTRGFPKVTVDGINSIQIELRVPRRHGGMISGRITAANSVPVAEASVTVLRQLSTKLSIVEGGRTDSEGNFRIARLPAGDYLVRAVGLGKNERISSKDDPSDAVYFGSTNDVKEAVPDTVLSDQETGSINISLEAHQFATVSGVLKTPGDGKPLTDVMVRLSGSKTDHMITSDSEGRWSFSHVAPGEYTLFVGRMNNTPVPGDPKTVEPFIHRYQKLKVEESDLKDLVVELSKGGKISGTVTLEGNAMEKPRTILVRATSVEGDGQGSSGAQVIANGSFSIVGVPLGEITLRVDAFPMKTYITKAIMWNGIDLMKEKFRIDDGTEITNIQVVLAPVAKPQ
jgi:hypothetical protein